MATKNRSWNCLTVVDCIYDFIIKFWMVRWNKSYVGLQVAGEVKCHKYSRRRPDNGWSYMVEKLGSQGKRGAGGGWKFISLPDGSSRPLNDMEKMYVKRETPKRRRRIIAPYKWHGQPQFVEMQFFSTVFWRSPGRLKLKLWSSLEPPKLVLCFRSTVDGLMLMNIVFCNKDCFPTFRQLNNHLLNCWRSSHLYTLPSNISKPRASMPELQGKTLSI